MSPASAGRVLGHYRILDELGRGAQGQVFLAEDLRLSRKVALKVLSAGFASASVLMRFQREALAASRLDPPGICSVYDYGEADGMHFIAMRYLEALRRGYPVAFSALWRREKLTLANSVQPPAAPPPA